MHQSQFRQFEEWLISLEEPAGRALRVNRGRSSRREKLEAGRDTAPHHLEDIEFEVLLAVLLKARTEIDQAVEKASRGRGTRTSETQK